MTERRAVSAPASERAVSRQRFVSAPAAGAGIGRRVPWALVVFVIAFWLPWVGSRYDTFLGTQIAIDALFAVSLNLLLGTTGLVSFGHVAYFGVGAYVCGILMKTYGVPFTLAFPAAGLGAALFALISGYFCVRLTRLYFAMLTLAFSQIVWAIAYKWNSVTGGDQGIPEIPYPNLDWMSAVPGLTDLGDGARFFLLTLFIVAVCLAIIHRISRSPFGRMLTTIRDNPERAAFIGVNVRAYELAAFVVAGGFAGLAGALYGIFSRGVFADYVFWSKSAEVIIMTILGGIEYFWGPPIGALTLVWLNQQITDYTQYWPFVLGTLLLVLLFLFPGGIAGGIVAGCRYLKWQVVERRA
jgi:branched-chain amino acid transport system permease protein